MGGGGLDIIAVGRLHQEKVEFTKKTTLAPKGRNQENRATPYKKNSPPPFLL